MLEDYRIGKREGRSTLLVCVLEDCSIGRHAKGLLHWSVCWKEHLNGRRVGRSTLLVDVLDDYCMGRHV